MSRSEDYLNSYILPAKNAMFVSCTSGVNLLCMSPMLELCSY